MPVTLSCYARMPNYRNALKSAGPRAEEGKQRSRRMRLVMVTAETAITSLENAADYQVFETDHLRGIPATYCHSN